MASGPNQSKTQSSLFSSKSDPSIPPFTNNSPLNLNTEPPVPMPPFPPYQLQKFVLQPPPLNQHKAQSAPQDKLHLPQHPPPIQFPSLYLPPPHHQSPNLQKQLPPPNLPPPNLPPPNLPPSNLPPPNHPYPQQTQLHGPPPDLPLPLLRPQVPPARIQPLVPPPNIDPMFSGFIHNWRQTPNNAMSRAVHTSPLGQQQQQQQQQYNSTFYINKNDQMLNECDQTFLSKSNVAQYCKLSIEDKNWLKEFEENIVSHNTKIPLVEKIKEKIKEIKENKIQENKIKLSEVSLLASESQMLLTILAELKTEMEQNASTATAETWQRLVAQVKLTKEKFNFNIAKLQNPQINKAIQNRRCKRKRLKVNKKKFQEEKNKNMFEWKQKDVEIDIWREQIIKREKDKLREMQIKKEADSVLSEIRFKQNEASRMIQLLVSLKQLRLTRINKGDTFGYVTNPVSDNFFDTVLSKLQGLLSSQFKDYQLEEATLKVMMEESESKRSSHLSGRQGRDSATEVKIEKLLFGQSSEKTLTGEFDLQGLIKRRHEWDEFLTSEGNPLGSSVPLGWVVPPTNPNQQWANFLAP